MTKCLKQVAWMGLSWDDVKSTPAGRSVIRPLWLAPLPGGGLGLLAGPFRGAGWSQRAVATSARSCAFSFPVLFPLPAPWAFRPLVPPLAARHFTLMEASAAVRRRHASTESGFHRRPPSRGAGWGKGRGSGLVLALLADRGCLTRASAGPPAGDPQAIRTALMVAAALGGAVSHFRSKLLRRLDSPVS